MYFPVQSQWRSNVLPWNLLYKTWQRFLSPGVLGANERTTISLCKAHASKLQMCTKHQMLATASSQFSFSRLFLTCLRVVFRKKVLSCTDSSFPVNLNLILAQRVCPLKFHDAPWVKPGTTASNLLRICFELRPFAGQRQRQLDKLPVSPAEESKTKKNIF